METIELEGGKYVLHFDETNGTFIADRHGQHCWRDMTGDGMVLAMFQRIQDLEEQVTDVENHNDRIEEALDSQGIDLSEILYGS